MVRPELRSISVVWRCTAWPGVVRDLYIVCCLYDHIFCTHANLILLLDVAFRRVSRHDKMIIRHQRRELMAGGADVDLTTTRPPRSSLLRNAEPALGLCSFFRSLSMTALIPLFKAEKGCNPLTVPLCWLLVARPMPPSSDGSTAHSLPRRRGDCM